MPPLKEGEVITNSQHRYQGKNNSYHTDSIPFFGRAPDLVDKENAASTMYVYFSKAYDKVPCNHLASQLQERGAAGTTAR